jgi:predicted secreted protein
MKVNETITFTREVNGSTGYGIYPVYVKNLAFVRVDTDHPLPLPAIGAPTYQHWTFLAVKAGRAEIQFARFRPWDTSDAVYEDVLPIDVEDADAELPDAANAGGWSAFEKPDAEAQAAFKEAFAKLIGVDYDPLLVTKQVVNGVNRIFAANANVVYPNSVPYPAIIRIHKAPDGEAKVVKTTLLGDPRFAGAHKAFRKTTGDDKAVLAAAFEKFAGAKYTADYVSTQLVAGTNYRFAGTQTLVTKDAPKYPVLFTVYQPLFGGPVFTGAEKVYDLV